ncbi:hypothetical protein BO70DRAFT_427245 [Aspergillus heteromorphus CBS 117.55]|uniref:SPIN90/Ldb17 leucine-rich domain-containing protein n=1 Tax=Aspergillus heteromorphus CBS 117.55 TaxID=1448321 RepID=A0A317WPP6_9EURO|nr:uncharacterized protein BO70DRAFT_427245 [Aspergillus heteromorphus CBS 117.55]PWY88474.1 hypothetical protein BO70DRAFT_427245 [Aspergillus heteromorphus CBS 117.55]
MEFEVSLENEQQFWDEIQEIVSVPCSSEDHIDDALRSYLSLSAKYRDEYLQSDLDITRCSYKLLASNIFVAHTDYVRRQMIYGLLQDDDPATLHVIVSFLLFDGRQHDVAFRMMNEEGLFPRLLELLQARNQREEEGVTAGLHRQLMDLIYEMSRIQRVKIEDLVLVDDDFVKGLFDIIEDLSYDVNDPYHYPVIRVLLVLNEQFMISAHDPIEENLSTNTLTNKVIKILSMHGNLYKTFGENIILLINREAETSLQLLTLKLLYLIFTTPSTYEYFFTNDLHVLVDILIRNLLDLPEEASALRHTYLRVLYPLLAHTQLKYPPFYKRNELRRMLSNLVHGQLSDGEADSEKIMHFDEVDETTRRLVLRCATVEWLREVKPQKPQDETPALPLSASDGGPLDVEFGVPLESFRTLSPTSTVDSTPESLSPTRVDGSGSSFPKLDADRKLSQAQRLGMHLEPASSSSLSVQEVASQHEKPGVMTPSRNDVRAGAASPTSSSKIVGRPKIKPLPPKTRRWRGRRATEDEDHLAPTDRIPEDTESQHTSPLASTTGAHTPVDRRNSTSTSGLVPPPVPGHSRRSASNPPPAVPPPRRSTVPHFHAIHQALPVTSHCTPLTSPSRPAQQQQQQQQHHHHSISTPSTSTTAPPLSTSPNTLPPKHGQKPEPPKTRRRGRTRSAVPDSSDQPPLPSLPHVPDIPSEHLTHHPQPGEHITVDPPTDSEAPKPSATISVEEAVQNVSLE